MSDPNVLTQWMHGEAHERHDYFRDTYGGRQFLTKCEDNMWELSQEGYSTPLFRAKEQSLCMRYANNMASIESFQIANKSPYEFADNLFTGTAVALKCLLKNSAEGAEEGLKQVAQLEAHLAMLRTRLVQRTDEQSLASRAEEMVAIATKHIVTFYAEMIWGQPDIAEQRVNEIHSLAEDMHNEVLDSLGELGKRS